jgi:hypothetical protein
MIAKKTHPYIFRAGLNRFWRMQTAPLFWNYQLRLNLMLKSFFNLLSRRIFKLKFYIFFYKLYLVDFFTTIIHFYFCFLKRKLKYLFKIPFNSLLISRKKLFFRSKLYSTILINISTVFFSRVGLIYKIISNLFRQTILQIKKIILNFSIFTSKTKKVYWRLLPLFLKQLVLKKNPTIYTDYWLKHFKTKYWLPKLHLLFTMPVLHQILKKCFIIPMNF